MAPLPTWPVASALLRPHVLPGGLHPCFRGISQRIPKKISFRTLYLVTPMPFQIKRRISPLQSFPQTDFSGKTQVKSIWKQNLKNLPWLPLPVEQSPDTQLTYQTLHSRAPDGPLAWSPAALPPGPLCPVTSMSSNPSPAFGVCCPADMLQWSVCSGSLLLTFWKIIIIVGDDITFIRMHYKPYIPVHLSM